MLRSGRGKLFYKMENCTQSCILLPILTMIDPKDCIAHMMTLLICVSDISFPSVAGQIFLKPKKVWKTVLHWKEEVKQFILGIPKPLGIPETAV